MSGSQTAIINMQETQLGGSGHYLNADDVMISTSSLNRQLQPPPYSRRGYRSPPPPSEPNNSTAQNSSPHQSQGQTTRSSRGQAVNLNRDPTSSDPPPYPGALVIGATVRPTNTS
ncbi:uncharacterized protein LOC142356109 [Convolutriloba macropyga]|uniref:uncharacterized protein LOC142356109 n=1 Tax=Convolutriloba macropyga TaxID=536237 RepID=UPI003F52282A